ncbi:MAG TPA: PAS domain-containing protein [Candidatus Cybelea sp.]|nr:PAS domain-containing protein [Candidatus Cybelea sp.]
MSFQAFLDSIHAAELRAVALHWNTARSNRAMPAWRDIDPVAIGPHLRYVWAWKYDAAHDTFSGRLAGEEIDRAFGKSLRGVPMTEFFSPEAFSVAFPRHRRVATEPCFMHGEGLVFVHVGRLLVGERIIMPLAEDGVHGDGIVGATIYHAGAARPDERPFGPDYSTEQVEFFPIDMPEVSATSA